MTRLRLSIITNALFAVTLAAVTTGCASTQLGPPPSSVDLRNNGSDREQDALYDKYQLGYNGSAFERPAAEKVSVAGLLIAPQAKPESDSARNYVMSSEKAAELYDGPMLWTHRILGTGLPYLITDGAILATGSVGGAVAGAAINAGTGNPGQILSGAVCGGLVGGALALMTAGACVGVGYNVARPIIGILALNTYRETANAFNADLRSKILDQAGKKGMGAEGGFEDRPPPPASETAPPPPPPEEVDAPPPEELDLAPPPPSDPYAENPSFAY